VKPSFWRLSSSTNTFFIFLASFGARWSENRGRDCGARLGFSCRDRWAHQVAQGGCGAPPAKSAVTKFHALQSAVDDAQSFRQQAGDSHLGDPSQLPQSLAPSERFAPADPPTGIPSRS
jgi:hypothetical protein